MSTCRKMPKHAAHATLERERTRSRIVDDEPAPPAALEECLGVLPLLATTTTSPRSTSSGLMAW